ncbi:voltage-gated chloride channel [Candidatus Marinamargulisbacteria bacterium SCGC AAA071-K20]|nr:voltage-gated chloride channel [Candidatus Marinamargulisbacteria bacterium SCGC AAA071-K20]
MSIFKWSFLAVIIGTLVGGSTAIFLRLLELGIVFAGTVSWYYFFLPVALFISILFTFYISPDSEGHGTEKVIQAIHRDNGKLRARIIPIKLFTTLLTLISGGSAGKEGPCAQIGAGLASVLSNLFNFSQSDRKKLVICGISAGFAAVFGTPIAGAIFGVEVLFVGGILYEVLLPSFISGMVGYHMAMNFGVGYGHHFQDYAMNFSITYFLELVLAGVFFGLVSFAFIELMKYSHRLSNKLHVWPPLKGIIGGVLLVMIAYFISTDYLGLGLHVIDHALSGGEIIWYAFIIKSVATCITLSLGGSGGILTPIFFIGATAGVFFANLFGLDPGLFAAVGMVSVLAGAANTPISACILAVELFGSNMASFAAVSCVVSFLMTGYRSVYPSQILSVKKSPSVIARHGQEMDSLSTGVEYRTRRQMVSMLHVIRKAKKAGLSSYGK